MGDVGDTDPTHELVHTVGSQRVATERQGSQGGLRVEKRPEVPRGGRAELVVGDVERLDRAGAAMTFLEY